MPAVLGERRERPPQQRPWVTWLRVLLCIWCLSSAQGHGFWAAAASQVAEGVGVILQDNHAAARDQAIQDALRNALLQRMEQVLEPTVSVERLQSLQARLTARTLQYIRSYRVLWEYPDTKQKVYRVGIEAELTSEVSQMGRGLPLREPLRTIVVRMVEKQGEREGLGTAGQERSIVAEEMSTTLRSWGYWVVASGTEAVWDGQESSALAAAQEAAAGVVIIGSAEVRQLRSEPTAVLIQATAQARLMVTRPRLKLAQERYQTTIAHTDATLGMQQALKDVAYVVVARLQAALKPYRQQVQEEQAREQRSQELSGHESTGTLPSAP